MRGTYFHTHTTIIAKAGVHCKISDNFSAYI